MSRDALGEGTLSRLVIALDRGTVARHGTRPKNLVSVSARLNVTDLVSLLSSRAALRQLAPRMLLSQPPTCLAY